MFDFNSVPVDLDGFNEFEKQLALTWTQCKFKDFLSKNPDAGGKQQSTEFLDILEDSLYVITDFRKRFASN
ncbi:hypothetical protein [Oscillibacter sp.]|uniref:hypothetical protein n=1 Tax=Oscillibacter sp. TaxID=1945593 RepID=UPI00289B6C73|nr:hypothetical protein [Oscillibacter sp.]